MKICLELGCCSDSSFKDFYKVYEGSACQLELMQPTTSESVLSLDVAGVKLPFHLRDVEIRISSI